METEEAIVTLAVEMWRVLRSFGRAVEHMPWVQQERVRAQLRYSERRLNAVLADRTLELVEFEGQEYEPNLPVTAVNGEDYRGAERLGVAQTLEPAVLSRGRVLRVGRVILERRG